MNKIETLFLAETKDDWNRGLLGSLGTIPTTKGLNIR
jgi:hypothetical protein